MKNKLNFYNNENIYLFIIFIFWFFFIGHKIVYEPFIWDDLHLIRKYSIDELISVWSSSWDPDLVETASYRPLATLFYHFQSTMFGENVLYQKIFIFLILYFLLTLIIILFNKINFNKNEIFLILLFLVFSKIFTTLASWMTLSHLIFCYILLILSLINFLSWLEKNKFFYLIFSIFFAVATLLTREEVYYIPFLIFFIGLYDSNFTKKEILKIALLSMFLCSLVILHYYLRSIFTEDAPQVHLALRTFVKYIMASGMPAGWFSSILQLTFFQITWIILILFTSLFLLKNIKKISFDEKKNILILLAMVVVTSTPSLASARSFGIFIPTIFSLALIIKIYYLFKKHFGNFIHNNIVFRIPNLIITLLLISGIFGGYLRSHEHLESINKNSIYIVAYDTSVVFKKREKEISIPKIRKKKKKKDLQNLGIISFITLNEIKKKITKGEISSKIYLPNFHPLSF